MFRSTAMILALFGSLLLFGACGGGDEEGLGECPPDSMLQQMAGATVIMDSCLSCHATDAANRNGAPATANFDNETTVTNMKDAIYAKVSGTYTSGTVMPPSGMLPADDVEDIRVYLSCLQ